LTPSSADTGFVPTLRCGRFVLALDRPLVMGVLNVTEDSFSDGGRWLDPAAAVAQPGDQLDWNKLPGLSDCGQFDLARDGLMFAWRWHLDTSPRVLEIAHYANNAGTHLYPAQGLVRFDEAELRSETPLTHELEIAATEYRSGSGSGAPAALPLSSGLISSGECSPFLTSTSSYT
jgi:hypothetical protein